MAFYGARVLYCLLSELAEIHGCQQKAAEGFVEKLGVRNTEGTIITSPKYVLTNTESIDTFIAVSFLLSLSLPLTGSKLIDNLRSSLASDVSGVSLAQIPSNRGSVKTYSAISV